MTLLEVRDLHVRFRTERGPVDAVRGVSYALEPGEVVAMVGESGSGKSAGALALLGLLPASATVTGQALLGDPQGPLDLLAMPPRQLRTVRGRRLAMIFQDPAGALNPVRSIGSQLTEAVRAHEDLPRRAAQRRAGDALELVRLPRARLEAFPHELSGGQRQRVMIAMAVLHRPDVIVADEPTTALDVTVQAQILQLLLAVRDEVGAAVLLITHDLPVVADIADRVLVMYAGRVVESGATGQVFARPRMPYTAGLLAAVPRRGVPLRGIPDVPPADVVR